MYKVLRFLMLCCCDPDFRKWRVKSSHWLSPTCIPQLQQAIRILLHMQPFKALLQEEWHIHKDHPSSLLTNNPTPLPLPSNRTVNPDIPVLPNNRTVKPDTRAPNLGLLLTDIQLQVRSATVSHRWSFCLLSHRVSLLLRRTVCR